VHLAVPLLGNDHARRFGLLDDVEQRTGVDLGDLLEQREREGASDDGAGGEHLLGLGPQPLQPATDDEPDALRDVEFVDGDVGPEGPVLVEDLSFLDQVAEHLLDEEGVAFRLVEDGGGELLGGGAPSERLEHRRDAAAVEALQGDALQNPCPRQALDRGGERPGDVELDVPIRAHGDHPDLRHHRRHVFDEQQRRLVGPVHVVHHEQQRET